ncbi:zinc finger protein 407 isoform X2 [Carettochelys insculpta]|uniref:zinc finger protein 407 isoform X2 n=1 Tax=Carettochelys insculpta TaxID=44489 RepID=UPI003EC09AC3
MDAGENQKNDEIDGSLQTDLTKESVRNVSVENVECDSLPNQKTSFLSAGVHRSLEKKEENGKNKRTLSESISLDITEGEQLENEPIPKRTKLDVSKNTKGSEGKSLELTVSGQQSVAETDSIEDGAIKRVAVSDCITGDTSLSMYVCPHCDFKTADATALKIHLQSKDSQEVPCAVPESTFQVEEISVSHTAGNIDQVHKCKICDQGFSSYPDLERHIQEVHSKQPKQQMCPHCSYKAECSPALQTHIKQIHGQPKIFCCNLCGFQCGEENLLRFHFLGKRHLRHQQLVARGGFVQKLTKRSSHKKQYIAVKKKVEAKSGPCKSKTRTANSKELNAKNNLKDLRVNLSKQSASSELLGEMITSKNISSEKSETITEENVVSFSVEGTHDLQAEKLDVSGSSKENLNKQEPTRSTKKIMESLNRTRRLYRSGHKRNILSLRTSFRQSGSFRLKKQVIGKYSLLGVSKRGNPKSHRMQVKHNFRTQRQPGDLTPKSPVELEMDDGDVNSQCKATSEIYAMNQDRTNTSSPGTSKSEESQMKPGAENKDLHTCIYCGIAFQNRRSLEIHVIRRHTNEMQFHCQTCNYSCAVRGDIEQHCQSNKHQMGSYNFNCHLCSFICLNDTSLRTHMSEKHNMPHNCTICNLYFLTEEELIDHRTTEKHVSLLAPQNISLSISTDLSLPTASYSTLESNNNLQKIVDEIEVTMEEECPKPCVIHYGNELKHSVLNKTQFQCKKCFYKTRSSTVLTRHIKLRHAQEFHFLCKACNLYSLSKEGMEKHIKRSKHLENARKNNIGLRFEECIERVCVDISDVKQVMEPSSSSNIKTELDKENILAPSSPSDNTFTEKELVPSGEIIKDSELGLANTPKRGRPKGTISRTCAHCGLLASSVTNLSVHIRRKHSHQYSYLCKVCNYYTVTKGDMERHCATKKHKGRVEIEANGKQNTEVVVYPEGGNPESTSKNLNSPIDILNANVEYGSQSLDLDSSVLENKADEQMNSTEGEVDNISQFTDLQYTKNPVNIKQQIFVGPSKVTQDGDPGFQRRVTGANDNKCEHCEFIAHSSSSLELHIKRKHTKEFEYYCMACDYYAVTRREMMRHAATEKHKIKRQSYVCCSSGEEAETTDIAKETSAMSPEDHQQDTEEFQAVSDETKYVNSVKARDDQMVKSLDDCSVLNENTTSEISKKGGAHTATEVEIEEESNGQEHLLYEVIQQTSHKDEAVELGEMIPLKEAVSCDLQKNGQDTKNSNFHCTVQNQNISSDMNDPNLDAKQSRKTLEESGSDLENKYKNTDVLEELLTESTPYVPELPETHNAAERSELDENIRNAAENLHSVEGDRIFQKDSTIEEEVVEEETLMEAKHEAEVTINNNIWEADGSTAEGMQETSNEALGTVVSDDKGKAIQNCGQFDSSIVKLKSHQDGESTDYSDEGQMSSGVKVSEVTVKVDSLLGGGKKKKSEGSPLGESTRIRCDDCGFLADGLSGLNVHIAMKHPSKEKHFHCLLCGKSFYTESNLHQHLASAGHMRNEQASVEELPEGGATFKCVKCTEPFDSEQNLFLHIKEQHEELLREVNKYIVEDTEQINREREENQGNVCKYCGKMCRSSNSMAFLAHIRTHTGSKPFKCKICHFATAQLGDARNHVKRHLGMREYKCHVCGKFTCHLCDRSFTEKWALNNHMKLHTGEKPFKCTWPTCHYSFLTASAMKDHYRTHTGEKSFLCDLCGFAGGTRHALTKHRRQHTGEKPFRCDECNFASTTQSHLTRHKRVHTGEKPYRCPWCDYRSNCAENIRKHILHTGKHEGVKMYNCPKCDYGTNVPVEFRNHLKELHPDIENPDLAYLHAGIVSKSYECRLKGQGATFVETTSPFTAAALGEISPVKEKALRSSRRQCQSAEQVQQVIIIQGYDGDFAIDASVEETAAATLQTLAMAGQVARVVHITEDGQVIATSQNGSHVSGMAPGQILTEQFSGGATQVVVVESSVEGTDIEADVPINAISDSSSAVVQQIMRQEVLDASEAAAHPPDASSALDALLCAVTELGEVENKTGPLDRTRPSHKDLLQMPNQERDNNPNDTETQEIQMFHEVQGTQEDIQPMEVVTQVIHPSTLIASQERAQAAFKKMVQGVLQFAVCDTAAADQLMKEGVTQVIVNEEGTVHMVAGEGSQIIMQETGRHGLSVQSEHMDLVESDGEISQIIVTEEIAQAMVQDSHGNFSEGPTHYIVTELPQDLQDDTGVYSHTVIETSESQEVLETGTAINAEAASLDETGEQLTSMVIYTESGSQAAVIQGQKDSNELQEA